MQLDTATWTARLDMRQPERDRRGYAGRRAAVAAVFGALTVVGVVLVVAGVVEGLAAMGVLIVVIVTFFTAVVALIQRANVLTIARLQGDDRILAVVHDEGIVLRGGLVIGWHEVTRVSIARTRRGGRGIAGASTRALMRADGLSEVWTTVALDLRDWEPILERATTRPMAASLTRPLLGQPGAATIDLGTLPEPAVQQTLAAIAQQAQRHGIPVAG